jgi:hemerythrin superfamily protein
MSRSKQTKDAIALLKADHRQVEDWFEQFEKARDDERRQELATKICHALKIHTTIEEEIFYPAFLEASDDIDIHHEAEIEHDGAKNPIAKIEACSPDDDYFAPSVRVLSEMIKHHVKEEEKPGGMFAVAREASLDLVSLGEELAARKAELESGETDEPDMPPPGVGEKSGRVDRLMKETR